MTRTMQVYVNGQLVAASLFPADVVDFTASEVHEATGFTIGGQCKEL